MSKTNLVLFLAIVCVLIIGGIFFFVSFSNQNNTTVDDYKQIEATDLDNTISTDEFATTTPEDTSTSTLIVSSTISSATMTDTATSTNENALPRVRISTNKGDIVVELFVNDAPKTAENFLTLAGKNFYDGVIFHRVIKGFMIQGGDPTGTGMGGPGYKFEDELNPATESYKRGYLRGTLAMANSGPNTNGSQFFIMHADYPLPNAYTIFGRVVSGIEVVDAIAESPTGRNDKPVSDIVMTKVEEVK